MMKLQVSLKTAEKGSAPSTFEVVVNGSDSVKSVKDKVAASQLIAFPERSLLLAGKKLDDTATLTSCGVDEASALEFVIEATEETVVRQLTDLLAARDLTTDELGLLYCYKHGVSTNQALKTIGSEAKLVDFLTGRKEFVVDGAKVALKRAATPARKEAPAPTRKEAAAPTRKEATPAPVRKEPAAAAAARKARSKSPQVARQQLRAPPRTKSPARREEAKSLLDTHAESEKMYEELHAKIAPRNFSSRASQMLSTIKDAVEQRSFLNVQEVVKGGSIGKGTAIVGNEDAELVFFVQGLPTAGYGKWLAPLLKLLQATLQGCIPADIATNIEATEDAVRLTCKGGMVVHLRFCPAFARYEDAVQALGSLGPYARKPFEPCFVKERTQFVAKQPGPVKSTMRLLKWWRDQQQWTCALTQPSDFLLELVVIYAAQQTGKATQAQMMANCMALLARFDELRVVWSNYYSPTDVWAPLMLQKPLLMDPVSPFSNVADPQDFDARELMSFAATTHFFW